MNHLIILRGNSGSGKTTIANLLCDRIENSFLISQDIVRRSMLKESDGPNCETKDLVTELVKFGLERSKTVIIEGIFRAEWYEEMFAQIVPLFDSVQAYYFDLSLEETTRRHQTRKEVHEFGEDKLRLWYKKENYLKCVSETKIDAQISKEELVIRIIEQCS
ncbi:MAG: kinase [Firmicutes bacterium]|nr:kinase [Bacillota bacterium]